MTILQVAFSETRGGAARAAMRLHRALRDAGEDSRFLARHALQDNSRPAGFAERCAATRALLTADVGNLLLKLQRPDHLAERSAAWLPSPLAGRIANTPHRLVNLHWLGGETLSVAQVGRLRGPVVWTLHDMWAFCGCEHYAADSGDARWRSGYRRNNRPAGLRGLDLDRWTWRRKLQHWKRPFTLITPSRWLADCVRGSRLLHDWPVHVVPNPLDTATFSPVDRRQARRQLDLPDDHAVILFGAMGGTQDPRKGFDLLQAALFRLRENDRLLNCTCMVLGESEPARPPALPYPVVWLGRVDADDALARIYSAADVLVLPSRQDNLPQSGTEAQACGCPVVAFNTGGMPDIVAHRESGYLAEPFDTGDLAAGITWSLQANRGDRPLSVSARQRAVAHWSPEVVIPAYLDVYRRAIAAG